METKSEETSSEKVKEISEGIREADETEKEKPKDPNKINFTNKQIQDVKAAMDYGMGPLAQIIAATGWKSSDKFNMLKTIKRITLSPEAAALETQIEQIKKRHQEKQKDLPDEERVALLNDDPELIALMAQDSGLTGERLHLKVKVIPDAVSVAAILGAEWLIKIELGK